jgi:segregation and condensation protein B
MSLKAKIEAVIYASEEPVTLAQLVGLLGHEAQAELDQQAAQQAAAQHTLSLNETEVDLEEAAETDPTLNPDAPTTEPGAPEPALSLPKGPALADVGSDPIPAEQGSEASPEAPAEPTPEETTTHTAKAEKEKARALRDYFRTLLEALIADYATSDRGIEIREVAGGYRLATKPEYHDAVRGFVKSLKPPLKLSLQALETLAVVAYKQPVTAPEISEIRGVDSGGVLGSLMTRKLITTAGRKQVIGRPILYKTTKDFLLRFGLKDISELPSIEEFEKMAGELADQEEIPMEHHAPESAYDLEPHRHTHIPQADGSPDTADNPLDIEVADAFADNPVREDFSDIRPRDKESGQFEKSNDDVVDTVPVDGRISGPPPADSDPDDPSAEEAEIQRSQTE